jgi:hypothetical protein
VAVAVGRDEDAVGIERVDVLDRIVLAKLCARFGCARREPADEPRRLDRAVTRVRDGAVELPSCRSWDVVEPLSGDPVLAQRLVLEPDRFALLLVGGEAVAAGAAKSVAGELGEPVELLLRPEPVRLRALGAVRLTRDVVARRAATEGEAAVAPARPLGDAARVVDADAQASFRKTERRRAAGDAGADDRDVDPAVMAGVYAGWSRIFEPERVQEVRR